MDFYHQLNYYPVSHFPNNKRDILKDTFSYLARIENINQQQLSTFSFDSTWTSRKQSENHEQANPPYLIMPVQQSDNSGTSTEDRSPSTPELSYDPVFAMPGPELSGPLYTRGSPQITSVLSSCPTFQEPAPHDGGYLAPQQSPYPLYWPTSFHGLLSETSSLYLGGAVNPQQLQAHMLSTRRSASPAPAFSYAHMQSVSPYQPSAQLAQQPDATWQAMPSGLSSGSGSPSPNEMAFDPNVAQPDDDTRELPYNELLFQCLMESEHKEMPLKEIYQWFVERTEKRWSPNQKGWQNSIRHNLSMNVAFQKGTRNNRDNPKKTMWCLTDEAIATGKVYPTTRYRKNNDRQSYRNRTHGSPAPQRQISGARGGHAARRSARLKNQHNAAGRNARHSSAPVPANSQIEWTPHNTSPSMNITHPSPTISMVPSYNLDQPQQHAAYNAPYYSASPTPLLGNAYLMNDHSIGSHDHRQSFTGVPSHAAFYSNPSDRRTFTGFPEQQTFSGFVEQHTLSGFPEYQLAHNHIDTAEFNGNATMSQWDPHYTEYVHNDMYVERQATGVAALPTSFASTHSIDPSFYSLPQQQQELRYVNANGHDGTTDVELSHDVGNGHPYINMDHDTLAISSDEEADEPMTPPSAKMHEDWGQAFFGRDEE